jgi:hypothetical protein
VIIGKEIIPPFALFSIIIAGVANLYIYIIDYADII